MSRAWRWFLPGYVVTLPLTVAALVYALFVGAHSWRWQDGCLTFLSSKLVGSPGGQCWSPVIGFADETQRARRDLQVHERCHVVQAMLVQLLAPLLIYVWTLGDLSWGWSLPGGSLFVLDMLWLLASAAPFAICYGSIFARHYADTDEPGEQDGWHDDYLRNVLERQAYARQRAFLALPPSKQVHVWGYR